MRSAEARGVPNVNMLASERDPVEMIIAVAKRDVYPTR
jgi:hypothetical protein